MLECIVSENVCAVISQLKHYLQTLIQVFFLRHYNWHIFILHSCLCYYFHWLQIDFLILFFCFTVIFCLLLKFFRFSLRFCLLYFLGFCLFNLLSLFFKRLTESHNVLVKLTGVYHPFMIFVVDVLKVVGKIFIAKLAVLAISWVIVWCLK